MKTPRACSSFLLRFVLISYAASLPVTVFAQSQHTPPPQPAQATETPGAATPDPSDTAPTFDGAPFRGQIIVQPPEAARVFGKDYAVNKALNARGFALLDISQDVTFTYNLLSPPVPLAQQSYNGERPTFVTSHYPGLTYDMRAFHMHGGQLLVQAAIQRNSWYPGGPEATGFGQISYYQSLFRNRVELKGGYIDNDGEFVGLFVGGIASNGSLGVYAVLPFEVGMSFLPKTAPALNATFHTADHTYSKVGFQRSFDAKGAGNEEARNKVGTRFDPRGDGLLMIYEGGYKRDPSPNKMQTWARVGYMYNDTHYPSMRPGPAPGRTLMTGNNQVVYVLADRQLKQFDEAKPGRGLYAGFSAEYAPPAQNTYTQYFEGRAYENGPFTKRPEDFVSLVVSHTAYSDVAKEAFQAAHQSYGKAATSVTASYVTRLCRGTYLATGLGYTDGPAVSPRSHNALNLLGQLTTFF